MYPVFIAVPPAIALTPLLVWLGDKLVWNFALTRERVDQLIV
jgi:hypothetical protein